MTSLKIRVYKGDEVLPQTTVSVPCTVLKIASRLVPKKALDALQEEGIDMDEILKLSQNPEARGTILEVEEHGKNEKVVISLE